MKDLFKVKEYLVKVNKSLIKIMFFIVENVIKFYWFEFLKFDKFMNVKIVVFIMFIVIVL